MHLPQRITTWLETHWVAPAYSGWLLVGLSIFFFAAATNTMAGWLYVISGVMFALLAIAAVLPARSLRGIAVRRAEIQPVTVGDAIAVELELENRTAQPKTLIQIRDLLPHVLAQPQQQAIEAVPARQTYRWSYAQPTQQRGVYRWHTVELRTAAPLGLFWRQRSQTVKALAIVYPTVLPLNQCPLIDEMGRQINAQVQNSYNPYSSTEGLTRTLRPYRWGDPTRLVHWRTSARFSELRVRELEVFTGGQEIVIALDSAASWQSENFEQAVIAAASLYFYALHHRLQIRLWTAATGILSGNQAVLEALAATRAEEELQASRPDLPLVWLTQDATQINRLPIGSRWLLWTVGRLELLPDREFPGFVIQAEQSLQLQLQAPLSR